MARDRSRGIQRAEMLRTRRKNGAPRVAKTAVCRSAATGIPKCPGAAWPGCAMRASTTTRQAASTVSGRQRRGEVRSLQMASRPQSVTRSGAEPRLAVGPRSGAPAGAL
jgi:hypothetical protein